MRFSIGVQEKWYGKDLGGDYLTAALVFETKNVDLFQINQSKGKEDRVGITIFSLNKWTNYVRQYLELFTIRKI